MTVVTNKISVYGDSTAISQLGSQTRAQRIAAYSAKFNGYNDYAVGGTSFASMFLGQDGLGNPLPGWNNRNFQQQIAVDDCDICIFNLGGNDKANGVSGALLQANAVPEDYVGSDGLTIASNALQMIQFAVAAGKRMVVCGVPFFDAVQSVAYYGGVPVLSDRRTSTGHHLPVRHLQYSHQVRSRLRRGSLRSHLRLPGESGTTCRRVGQHPGWCASHGGLQSCSQRLPRGRHHFLLRSLKFGRRAWRTSGAPANTLLPRLSRFRTQSVRGITCIQEPHG